MTSTAVDARLLGVVAVDASCHGYFGFLVELDPFRNRPVALLTRGAMLQMNLMTEAHKRRQFINPHPRNRSIRFGVRCQFLNARIVGGDCLVALHARRGPRNRYRFAGSRKRVAVFAGHLQRARMLFVAEGNGLSGPSQPFGRRSRYGLLSCGSIGARGAALCRRSRRRFR